MKRVPRERTKDLHLHHLTEKFTTNITGLKNITFTQPPFLLVCNLISVVFNIMHLSIMVLYLCL